MGGAGVGAEVLAEAVVVPDPAGGGRAGVGEPLLRTRLLEICFDTFVRRTGVLLVVLLTPLVVVVLLLVVTHRLYRLLDLKLSRH